MEILTLQYRHTWN